METVETWLDERAYLTRSTLGRLRGALAQALEIARKRRQITWNPAVLAELPVAKKRQPGEILYWQEVDQLLKAAQGDRLEAWLHLMLDTGFRPHESYELEWDDVDLTEPTVTARPRKALAKEPREVEIDAALRAQLVAHRRRQNEERLLMGGRWPTEYERLVFRSEAGTPLDGRNMNRRLKEWLLKAEISKHLHVYDLRHTAASLLADAGVPVVTIADYLGNDPATLEKFYRKPVTPVRRVGVNITARAATRE